MNKDNTTIIDQIREALVKSFGKAFAEVSATELIMEVIKQIPSKRKIELEELVQLSEEGCWYVEIEINNAYDVTLHFPVLECSLNETTFTVRAADAEYYADFKIDTNKIEDLSTTDEGEIKSISMKVAGGYLTFRREEMEYSLDETEGLVIKEE